MDKKLGREVLRDRIARIIAATRYPFVDQENWDEDRTVIINPMGGEAWGVEGPEGLVYPSVVVLNPDGSVRELGEVEMGDSVTNAQVPKWRLLSQRTGRGERFKKFFLYVPEGTEAEAERLLEENHIEYAGLRAWSIRDGVLMVRPVKTPDMAEDHKVS